MLNSLYRFSYLFSSIFFCFSEYDANDTGNNDSAMEPLTSVSNGSTTITTSDHIISSSHTISRDITSIKQKVNVFTNEHSIHQEWILLAHVINRVCCFIYLFFFAFSIRNHIF